jgi:deoxyribose-phosphate aldolase
MKSMLRKNEAIRPEQIVCAPETAKLALECLDLTSLNEDDTAEKIGALVDKADGVASVCVYPEFVALAKRLLSDKGIYGEVGITTVINFPSGVRTTKGTLDHSEAATPENTAAAVKSAIEDGATDIDIVLDYEGFLKGDAARGAALLEACRKAAGDVIVKVIVESAAYKNEDDLDRACEFAVKHGKPQFLKTSTGKHKDGGATPDAAEVLFSVAAWHGIGAKISGGVQTPEDCARYIALAKHYLRNITPDNFRIGASRVFGALKAIVCPQQARAPSPSPGTY